MIRSLRLEHLRPHRTHPAVDERMVYANHGQVRTVRETKTETAGGERILECILEGSEQWAARWRVEITAQDQCVWWRVAMCPFTLASASLMVFAQCALQAAAWIERVAQTITDEVDGQHRDQNKQLWPEDNQWRLKNRFLRTSQHVAP